GLITTAAVFVSETALFKEKLSMDLLIKIFWQPLEVLNIESIFIFLVSLIALKRFKLHPILTIALSGVLGILLFYVF
ncbi:MAG: chromate transporter, partial [Clostridiales bacterium]|nr:chromate transporter [Clostridiales bacterium]